MKEENKDGHKKIREEEGRGRRVRIEEKRSRRSNEIRKER